MQLQCAERHCAIRCHLWTYSVSKNVCIDLQLTVTALFCGQALVYASAGGAPERRNSPLFSPSDQIVREKGKLRCLSKRMMRENLSNGSQGTYLCLCIIWPLETLKQERLVATCHVSPAVIGSFSKDDEDGSENVKKAIGLLSKTTTLHVHHGFLYIALSSLHDYNVKVPNFTFCRGHERRRLYFSFLELWYSLLEFNSRKICQLLTNWTS